MANPRRIRKVRKSMPTIEGAGVHLKRAFGFQLPNFASGARSPFRCAQEDLDFFYFYDKYDKLFFERW
jgi:hypothetical protein